MALSRFTLQKNTIFFKVAVYRAARHRSNGRRISCKKRESRTAFELRRQLNSHVGRRCAPDDRRMFRRPLNGRAASVQLTLNLHLCLCRRAKRRQSWRESCIKKGAAGDRPSNFRDKANVSVEAVLDLFFSSSCNKFLLHYCTELFPLLSRFNY